MLCACEHVPQKPIVEYDTDSSIINIVQMDTAAHDTAYIDIENLCHKTLPIKDTVKLSILHSLKELNQIDVAYNLVKQNYKMKVRVRTTRTNDTVFQYQYLTFEIKPINIAEIISGTCRGFYDVNYNRNYYKYIRQWFFEKELTPDSALIEKIHSILKQLNYSGKNEYGLLNGRTPVVSSLTNLTFKIKANLPGKYFYLYSYPCQGGTPIKKFVESKITGGLNDAYKTINGTLKCSNRGGSGANVLFLVSIDENWKYNVLPIGVIGIDNIKPTINTKRYYFESRDYILWPDKITLQSHNILVHLPNGYCDISGSLDIGYGHFEGNDYYGYNIPFRIKTSGDIKTIIIGSHILNVNSIKNKDCVRLHIRNLRIGDNSLPLQAIDSRGNRTISHLSIPIHSIRYSYDNDNDYDYLESRVNDLESRMNDLE